MQGCACAHRSAQRKHIGMRNPCTAGITLEKPTKKEESKKLPRVHLDFRPIGNRQRRSSRRHDYFSQIRFSILPLSLRSNLILVEEEESKRWLKNPCLSQMAFSRRNHHKRNLGKGMF